MLERVEAEPQPEAFGQGNFFLHRFGWMQFVIGRMAVADVVGVVFGDHVAAVGGGVDQYVFRVAVERAIQDGFQCFVAGILRVKGEIVAKHDVSLATRPHEIDDFRQMMQIEAIDLDHAQPLRGKTSQARAYQRGFTSAACAGEQHVIGRQAAHELLGVVQYRLLLPVNREQIVQFLQTRVVQRL